MIISQLQKTTRLMDWVIVLWILMTGLICSSILLGKWQFNENRLPYLNFHTCELPCWIGITPNQTTLSKAIENAKLIFNEVQVSDFDDTVSLITILKERVYGYEIQFLSVSPQLAHSTSPVVKGIVITNLNTDVGTLMSYLGLPNSIAYFTFTGQQYTELYYDIYHLSFGIDPVHGVCNPLKVNSPVRAIGIASTITKPSTEFVHEWNGFVSCKHQ